MPYDLGRLDARLKWAVTCLLLTFGLAYLFGGVMVALYAGFAPEAHRRDLRGTGRCGGPGDDDGRGACDAHE